MAGFVRVGCTRLDKIITSRSQDGSIQRDVPVNPTCPNARDENLVPEDEGAEGVSQPSPQEDISGLATSKLFRKRGTQYPLTALYRLKPRGGKLTDGVGRSEQPGVSGAASQRVGVFIMHFSAQQTISPTLPFRGDDARRILRYRFLATEKRQGRNAQGLIDSPPAIGSQGRPRTPFDDLAQHHKPQVAVQALTPRLVFDWFGRDGVQQRLHALSSFFFIPGR